MLKTTKIIYQLIRQLSLTHNGVIIMESDSSSAIFTYFR